MHKASAYKVRRLFFTAFYLWATLILYSQEGVSYISNFTPPPGTNTKNTAITQDNRGLMLFANQQGILSFDGYKWEYACSGIRPYSIGRDTVTSSIFVGLEKSFGYLLRDETGSYKYIPISDPAYNYGRIEKIAFRKDAIYFYSPQSITVVNRDDIRNLQTIWAGQANPFTGFFFYNDRLFINIFNQGLHLLVNNKLSPIAGGEAFDNVSIVFYTKYDDNSLLFATDNSFLYLYDGNEFSDLIIKDESYLFNAVITHGISIDNNRVALATLTGGCIIFNKKTGKTENIFNYQSGLPDDEIYAIGTDREGGIWLSHEFGASRIDLSLPVLKFDSYKGLEGNISQLLIFNDTLFISTSEGVFYLSEVKYYRKREVFVKTLVPVYSNISSADNINTRQPENHQVNLPAEKQSFQEESKEAIAAGKKEKIKAKRRLFFRLFDKKQKQEKASLADSEATNTDKAKTTSVSKHTEKTVSPRTSVSYKTQYIKKTNLLLESVGYEFRKVKGLDAKCRQLLVYDNMLFVASSTGLYRISGNKSRYIIAGSYIHSVIASQKIPGRLYVGTESGIRTVDFAARNVKINNPNSGLSTAIHSVCEDNNKLWLASDRDILCMQIPADTGNTSFKSYRSPGKGETVIFRLGNKAVFFTESGIYDFNESSGSFVELDTIVPKHLKSLRCIYCREDQLWLNPEETWIKLPEMDSLSSLQSGFLKIFDGIRYLYTDEENNLWVVDGNNNIRKILPNETLHRPGIFDIHINEPATDLVSLGSKDFPKEFNVWAPCYIRPDRTEFKYLLEGLDHEWSDWTTNRSITIPYLPEGSYTLKVSARNVLNDISETIEQKIEVTPPFTRSLFFYIIIVVAIGVFLYLLIIIRERKLKHDKKVLERKVTIRTKEIQAQKNEIEKQKNEIAFQKQEITDSIEYGKRIQKALMRPRSALNKLLPEYFIFFRPRDLVSGDFYWVSRKDDKTVVAVADCTGHGVPGAFLSFLGHSFLEEIFNNFKITTASIFLDRLRVKFKIALHQSEDHDDAGDGIDMGLCILDNNTMEMQYAGALNSLYIIRKGKLIETKGDKMPIGSHLLDNKSFTNHKISLNKGDMVYMFTDGFPDQFGGERTKKFKIIPFQQLLLKIHRETLKKQEEILTTELQLWMGNEAQVDDILVLGMKI